MDFEVILYVSSSILHLAQSQELLSALKNDFELNELIFLAKILILVSYTGCPKKNGTRINQLCMHLKRNPHKLINVVCIMIHKLTAIKVLKAVSYTLILSSFVKTFIGNMITFVVAITQLMSLCFYYTFE